MGRNRGGWRVRAWLAAITVTSWIWAPAGPAVAAPGGETPPPAADPTTTTTLPALPPVDPRYTDGQAPQTLLGNAVTLASLGTDDSALVKAVGATQARLDADALAAKYATAQSRAAEASAAAARSAARRAGAQYASMAGAVEQAVVYLYMAGPTTLTVSPRAGPLALYAEIYAESTMGPYGVLARRQAVRADRAQALARARRQADMAAAAADRSDRALGDEQRQLDHLKAELTAALGTSAAAVASDHVALASQAGKELVAQSSLEFTPRAALPAPVATTDIALTWAFAELGKQYVWGATGPDTFDCSGLTQFVWKAASVSIPRVAADQDAWTIPVPLSQLLPGDLVFFGASDIHHVGIYIGDGLMINAPHTGTVVQVSSIWWSDLAGFGRVHAAGIPVPPHMTPSTSRPLPAAVVAAPGPVPSQSRPPAGWKPKPGETTPIDVPKPLSGTPSEPTSTTTGEPSTTSTDANSGAASTTTSMAANTTSSAPAAP